MFTGAGTAVSLFKKLRIKLIKPPLIRLIRVLERAPKFAGCSERGFLPAHG